MRRKIHMITLAFAVCLILAFSAKANAQTVVNEGTSTAVKVSEGKAGTAAYPAGSVNVVGFDTNEHSAIYLLKQPSKAVGAYVQLLNSSKKPIASDVRTFTESQNSQNYFITSKGVKAQKYYYYKARAIYYNTKTQEYYYGGWSKLKAFSTISVNAKQAGSFKASFTMPKISGIKKYDLYMSTSENKGFKKVATIKPGAKKVISSFNGKTLKKYGYNRKFYFYVKPYLNNGVSMPNFFIVNNFYFYKK